MPLPGILGGFETRQKQFFHIFGAKGKNQKFFFSGKIGFFEKYRYFIGKNRYLSENIGIYRKTAIFLLPIFPSQNRFQPNRKPIFRRKIGRKNRFLLPWSKVVFSLNLFSRDRFFLYGLKGVLRLTTVSSRYVT